MCVCVFVRSRVDRTGMSEAAATAAGCGGGAYMVVVFPAPLWPRNDVM